MTQNTGMHEGDNFFALLAPYGGSDGMLPPQKNNKILKMKYLRTQSGCIIAFPGMFNHDINYTL